MSIDGGGRKEASPPFFFSAEKVLHMACFRSELSAKPTIKSLQDLDAVLGELSVVDHYQSELTAACSREMDDIKSGYQAQMLCAIGKTTVDLATRRKQLVDVAETWCRKHLAKHLPAGERSMKLSNGKAGFREQAPKVQFGEGVTEKMVIDRIEQRSGIIAAVNALLTKAFEFFSLSQLIRFRPEINKVDLKAAWDAKPEARATLRDLGITVEAGEDLVVIEPAKHRVAKPAT